MVKPNVLLTDRTSFRKSNHNGSFNPLFEIRGLAVKEYEGTYSIWVHLMHYYPHATPKLWNEHTSLHWHVGVDIKKVRYSGLILDAEFKLAANKIYHRSVELLFRPPECR